MHIPNQLDEWDPMVFQDSTVLQYQVLEKEICQHEVQKEDFEEGMLLKGIQGHSEQEHQGPTGPAQQDACQRSFQHGNDLPLEHLNQEHRSEELPLASLWAKPDIYQQREDPVRLESHQEQAFQHQDFPLLKKSQHGPEPQLWDQQEPQQQQGLHRLKQGQEIQQDQQPGQDQQLKQNQELRRDQGQQQGLQLRQELLQQQGLKQPNLQQLMVQQKPKAHDQEEKSLIEHDSLLSKEVSVHEDFQEENKENQEPDTNNNNHQSPSRIKCARYCKLNCSSDFSDENISSIRKEFQSLQNHAKRQFYVSFVKETCSNISTASGSPKMITRYYLPLDRRSTEVCRTFWFAALQKTYNNNTEIRNALRSAASGTAPKNKRGNYRKDDSWIEEVKAHILSFHPHKSHYRRKSVPHRLYLPRDVTFRRMHEMFVEKMESMGRRPISYWSYYRVIRSMNISTKEPSNDTCSICLTFKESHEGCQERSCLVCEDHQKHLKRAMESRELYRQQSQEGPNHLVYCADLQKVFLLPKKDGIKEVLFTPRLVCFNETFAVAGQSSPDLKNYLCVWHEAERGRKSPDIASTFFNFLMKISQEKPNLPITIWTDNCGSQNKSFVLFSAMVSIVNSLNIPKICIRYFERGHTYMKADCLHGHIETKMKRHKCIYDFQQFLKIMRSANENTQTLPLTFRDFYQFRDQKSPKKVSKAKFKISKVVSAEFRKGSYSVFVGLSHTQDVLQKVSFLSRDFSPVLPLPHQVPRGINSAKKDRILKDIVPMLPDVSRYFWRDLYESKDSEDLLQKRYVD